MKHPKVIVLILSFNGKPLLEDSVSSYLDNDYENFEIVVIDNGSADGTKEYVHRKWPQAILYRTEKNRGYSGGFNFGLDYAFNQLAADFALITNNDVKVGRQVIAELVKVAQRDKMIGFVTGKVYYYDQPNIFQTTGYKIIDEDYWLVGHRGGMEPDEGQYDKVEELKFSDDVFMLVSRDVFQHTGGYNPDFHIQAEQFDWQIRAKKLGFKIYYAPAAKIWHKESMTIGKMSAYKTYYNVRNTFVVRLKHRNREYLNKYFKWYLPNVVVKPILKNTLKLKLNYAIKILSGFFSALWWGVRNDKVGLKGFK